MSADISFHPDSPVAIVMRQFAGHLRNLFMAGTRVGFGACLVSYQMGTADSFSRHNVASM
jgi:hypothetical protein